ncbi:MAG TPA: ADP-heptose--LPS heptosyltransferase [Bacteroidetes bacterium]|nr:ADP-heptose--LPS heptosyltransferase [Bacteroidota bacterium]
MNKETYNHVLIVRTDRIGDVVLTLPMIPVLRAHAPSCRIAMLVRPYTSELIAGTTGLDQIILYDEREARKGFRKLLGEIREQRFDLVVVSHPKFRIALLLYLAGIPERIGSGYRWYSFLFNRRVFEHRKTAEKHEAEYNISLLRAIGIDAQGVPNVSLSIPAAARAKAVAELESVGILESEKFVVLHPGSGGSARDWSPERFGELAKRLAAEGIKVVVTGDQKERTLVEMVVERSQGTARALIGRFNLKQLAAFLTLPKAFVSNSTGPLHIAAAVGTPVVAMYPPIRECSPRRWGPLTDKKIVFTADNTRCPRCKGGPCQGNDCMDQITVDDVLSAVRESAAR